MTEYRMLAGKDLVDSGLLEHMDAMNQPRPNLMLTVAWIAEDEGRIVAFSVLQGVPLVEPFHAEPGHGECLKELYKRTKEFILSSEAPRVLMHTSHPAMKLMLKREGVQVFPEEFFDWRGK